MPDGLVIAHRMGPNSQMTQRLAGLVPDATIVAWPEVGQILLTFDYPWRDGDQYLPDDVEWVHIMGAGVGGFPFELLKGRPLTCSKGASSVPIAEWVLAVMLAFEKQVAESWIHEPPEIWSRAHLGSLAGKEGLAGLSAYSAASAGVIAFTKALSREVAQHKVLVNCVAPGPIDTDMIRDLGADVVERMIRDSPVGRLGAPNEVAHVVAWLCSDASSFNTGAVFDMSGGRARY